MKVQAFRVARPSDDLDAVVRFYRDGVGLEVIASFDHHDGFDGVMLGLAGSSYHLEFTKNTKHPAGRAPSPDNLLIFYIPDRPTWDAAIRRMKDTGYDTVKSFNPFWDHLGVTFEDPDGYRVVFQNAEWAK